LNIIVGTYECKVDAKGRVLPAPLKKQLTLLSKRFRFEAFCFSTCSELYPMEEWDIMMAKINESVCKKEQ
jgi:MraZ protein